MASADWYTPSGAPTTNSLGSSSVMRNEFSLLETALDKLPTLTSKASLPIFVNSGGTALESVAVATARSQLGVANAGENILAPHEALICKYVTAATVDIDATAVLLKDSSSNLYRAGSVNLTVDITVSGANGLDTGAEASNTWYYLWVIYNGTTVAGLLSTSSSAPTMPSGYTYKGFVGSVYNGSLGDFLNFHQLGVNVATVALGSISNGSDTSYTSNAFTSISPLATTVSGLFWVRDSVGTSSAILSIASDSCGTGVQSVICPGGVTASDVTGAAFANMLLITAQTLYYKVTNANFQGTVQATSYSY